ncbi:MAG: ATP-binding cassette domain-containing protein, partial [Lachnospiraceae bacterium]|nr:ATP-binding cassette domain-containing protein [Lachnospiraceae bacterium]
LLEVGLEDTDRILNSYPGELSGGQRQRVLIAMAIANNPKLLICDEPTTALDKDVAERIVELIKKLHDEKKMSVIFISHDIDITRRLCDRIIIMQNGTIVERGKADVITDAPKTEYAAELIRAAKGRDYKAISAEAAENRGKAELSEAAGNGSGEQENIITVNNMSVSYKLPHGRKLDVIKDLSFSVRKGETLGISGESGSGKTTVLKALTGMKEFIGDVKVDGRFTMVFQDPFSSLDPSMRVGDMLREVLCLDEKRRRKMKTNASAADASEANIKEEHEGMRGIKTNAGTIRERISKMMADVGLDDSYLNHYPDELSGGQRQRVAIAMAFITNPDIVFLDEPVTALDVTIQDKIMTLLATLKGRYNMTIVMISHDGRLLSNFCDRVLKISQ